MKDKIKAHFEGNYLSFYEKHLKSIKHIGGEEYMAPCPFHDEVEPSFNFNSQKGTYLCRGCGKKGHAFHFFAKISSLDTRRDFRKILKGVAEAHGIPWEEEKAKLAATYDYYDLAGNLAHQAIIDWIPWQLFAKPNNLACKLGCSFFKIELVFVW